ncbi:MAG TPA: hypothetical protein VFC67_06545 [Prolixibacteraceae bacterium]|nr:hypothetical protein [Prolixibacteraceae bacterium]
MSTRCKIAKVNEDGTVTSVHCQYNGWANMDEGCVGLTLFKYYTTEDTINTLFIDKDLHSLEPLEFHDNLDGSLDVNPVFKTEQDWFNYAKWEDNQYIYLFKDGKWFANNLELTAKLLKKGVKESSYLEDEQRGNENHFQWQSRLNKKKERLAKQKKD